MEEWKRIREIQIYESKDRGENPIDKTNTDYSCSDLIFTTTNGTPINSQIYSDAIKRIIDQVNLCLPFEEKLEYFGGHCFRHTYATRLYEATKDIMLVAKSLGHKGIEMASKLYVHIDKDRSMSTAEVMDSLTKELGIEYSDIDGL